MHVQWGACDMHVTKLLRMPLTSLHLPHWLALHEGHAYCLWPLPHILLVCTTFVCVLFVATTTYTISVYYFSMHTACGHYHIYY